MAESKGGKAESGKSRISKNLLRPEAETGELATHILGRAESGQGQNRTGDTRLFRPLLYRLSYLSPKYNAVNISKISSLSKDFLQLKKRIQNTEFRMFDAPAISNNTFCLPYSEFCILLLK